MIATPTQRHWRWFGRLKCDTTLGKQDPMALLLLEALGALLIFVFIVWWTMFSGRKNGEPIDDNIPTDVETTDNQKPPRR